MKKKPAKKIAAKRRRNTEPDVNQLAHDLVRMSTEQEAARPAEEINVKATEPSKAEISRVMAALGRKGGRIGGKRRAAAMPPERRREIALKAARKRWDAEKEASL